MKKIYQQPMVQTIYLAPQQMIALSFNSDNSAGSGALGDDYAEDDAMAKDRGSGLW